MPSIEPILKTRVTDATKAAFLAQAAAQGWSEAHLLELIVTAFLNRSVDLSASTADSPAPTTLDGEKTKDVHVRLSVAEYQALDQLATMRHWKRGPYLAHLLRVHLTGQPRFGDDETRALRDATTQLSLLGRNVNQIARALNASPRVGHAADLMQTVSLADIKTLIDAQRVKLKDLIKANLRTWNVTDCTS